MGRRKSQVLIVNLRHKMLGEFFKAKRVAINKSQVAVAGELGFGSPQIISNWERGHCSPPYTSLKKLMEVYSISKDEMVEMISLATIAEVKDLLR
jgi:transcriptional regulator with XRE-family HTH domain